MVLSKLPDAKKLLLIWRIVLTDLKCPAKFFIHLLSNQTFIILSSEPERIYLLDSWHKHFIHFFVS